MTYHVGQLRKSDFAWGKYYTPQTLTPSENTNLNKGYTDIVCSHSFSSSNIYYVTFTVKGQNSGIQNFGVKLRSEDRSNSVDYQNLKTCQVSKTTGAVSFTIMFQPHMDYKLISFELIRDNSADITGDNGRKMDITIKNFGIINNVKDALNGNGYDITSFAQIGVRGNTGTLMCIDGEEVKVGPSGFYEINNGTKVNFIGFVPTTEDAYKSANFIMDFLYE